MGLLHLYILYCQSFGSKVYGKNEISIFFFGKVLLSIFGITMIATSLASFDFHIGYFASKSFVGNGIKPNLDFLIGPIAPLMAFVLGTFALVVCCGL
ncbi:MAG UNVERIFIED_CONTAM: hypothetical protein LVQ98_09150 [Rickettsiaceae bacterium]